MCCIFGTPASGIAMLATVGGPLLFGFGFDAPLAVYSGIAVPSGLRLTLKSRSGFPADWPHASLAQWNRNFHHSQAC
jgi:hypothetical protein